MANKKDVIVRTPGHNGTYQIGANGTTVGILRIYQEGSGTPYCLRQVDGTTTPISRETVQQLKKCSRSPEDYMPLLFPHLSKESRLWVRGAYAEYAQPRNKPRK